MKPIAALLFLAGALTAPGQTIQTLYSFPNINVADDPVGSLLIGADGALYGSTYEVPAVFRVAPPAEVGGAWKTSIIAQLPFQSIGTGGVAADPQGNVYVADQRDQFSAGKMYQLVPPASKGGTWTMTAIYTFDNNNSTGSSPYAAPVYFRDALLGTTAAGGASGAGVIYALKEISGVWNYSVLHSFSGSDGSAPGASLIADRQGNLYGTTIGGGTAGQGVAFEISPPASAGETWTYQVLHSFQGGTDGAQPQAGLTLGIEGALYGTTSEGGNSIQCNGAEKIWNGCGTVFRLSRPASGTGEWNETILHRFTGYDNGQDGGAPLGSMAFDKRGILYGTTACGGSENQGVIFSLTPSGDGASWTYVVALNFDTSASDPGAQPFGGLTRGPNGNLFGTTSTYDPDYGNAFYYGTVFKFTPAE